ncbi:nuclear receptor-binding factor 2-like [Contarinia nasturtii]|uniref:nuclear receptor-binding factor 2-like n=1 Tax=Contarinia nasturtii TaxID=265458 RepID=UPI0012D394A9|nr:nuclear receptor-binding factor 2-like [Contarinia nasturtii]
MENAPLNKAHYHGRQADSHLRHLRFDEAIESHQKAIIALEDTLKVASNQKVVESLIKQRDQQQKGIDLVILKKSQFEKYKEAVREERMKNRPVSLEQKVDAIRFESICDTQMSIFKTLKEQDSLLELLNIKCNSSSNDEGEVALERPKLSTENAKETKPQNPIIGDIISTNHQLHILVFNLVSQVDESSNELENLRKRVKKLEQEGKTSQGSNKSSSDSKSKSDESPTSSVKENRRDFTIDEERDNDLPESSELPPLDLPVFDYNFLNNT